MARAWMSNSPERSMSLRLAFSCLVSSCNCRRWAFAVDNSFKTIFVRLWVNRPNIQSVASKNTPKTAHPSNVPTFTRPNGDRIAIVTTQFRFVSHTPRCCGPKPTAKPGEPLSYLCASPEPRTAGTQPFVARISPLPTTLPHYHACCFPLFRIPCSQPKT